MGDEGQEEGGGLNYGSQYKRGRNRWRRNERRRRFSNSPRGSCWKEGSAAEAAEEATEEATARIRAEAQPGEADAKSPLLRRGRGGVGIMLERNSTKHEFLKSKIQ